MRAGLMKIEKEKNVTLHNFVQCSCKKLKKMNKSASFTTKCIMATEIVTENV